MSTTLTVTRMTCEHHGQRVADVLTGVDGIENATVNRGAKRATVEGNADTDALIAAVGDVGYNASTRTRTSWTGPRERRT